MQFTKLRLQGFKSFVDPAELLISTGLTGVVGPNGCGKSNLLEALRWVMGENRPTAMRGDGMEDVIFAGAESRPARNSASVEMIIDNRERLAPAAFNNDDTLEVSRRITRDIGSSFTVNGKNVRARDVQMLFADASTGAHSPALVRQGQIGELINAKPTARRRILEEAAGISGLYQRRHEAELKLNGAEANLARVEDVVEQLDAQLKSLERQAAQARRYRAIADELRRAEATLLFLRWRMADEEHAAAARALTEGTTAAAAAETTVLAARRHHEQAEVAMPPLRQEEAIAAALHQRLAIERDQLAERETRARAEIEALVGRARQLAIDLEREETLGRDADSTVERLDQEEVSLRTANTGHEPALVATQDAAREAAEQLSEQETALDRLTEEAARLSARSAAAERRREEARGAVQRIGEEIARTTAAEQTLAEEIGTVGAARAVAEQTEATARTEGAATEIALTAAETARTGAQNTEAEARAALSEIDGEITALKAEVQGLTRLMARESGDTAQLLDRVTAAPGYEAALGAALGDDLRAAELKSGAGATGWMTLPAYTKNAALPKGTETLAGQVNGPGLLARRLSQVGVVAREKGDALQAELTPGQRLVSRQGDLWRWDGFRVRAEDASSSTALRLQQRNRLNVLTVSLGEVEAKRAATSDTHDAARATLTAATGRESDLRDRRRLADQALAEAARALSKAEAELAMHGAKLETQRHSLELRRTERAEAENALKEAEEALTGLDNVAEARAAVEAKRGDVDLARIAMLAARSRADEVRRDGLVREKRMADIARERSGWKDRLEHAGNRIGELRLRIDETMAARANAEGAPDELARKRATLAADIETAETRRRAAGDALAEGETRLRAAETTEREAERKASDCREARARCEARLEGATERRDEASTRIRVDMELAPEQLLEAVGAGAENLPTLEVVETDVARLRRQRDSLGAVNLRADEDAAEVKAERDQIGTEKDDLEAAIGKLRAGIHELNREGRERIIRAFDQVNKKFADLFRHLFGGGEARLVMVESDDPLDAGLEILCQPPGKKLSTLSLLSGGEQTLTALSLIFAVFLSNPAPICVLDEVDAPLDDANVTRFCDLLDEMIRLTDTRFLIITHHAVTMSRMDRLFGVTMVERGVSQLVSVDLQKAAEMVEA
ncbi:MAG TPA: chromosome segregation protein SMC [Thermohalobaculum sp.]|nr:chromosome segregation protein SMC [Thermohalobaculum sp.]